MSDDLAVQGALFQALLGSSDLQALVGTRIYDEVPDATPDRPVTLPAVVLGDSTARNLQAGSVDCGQMAEIDTEILVFSRPPQRSAFAGSTEAKRIVAAIRAALTEDQPLTAPGWTFTHQRWLATTYRRTEDNQTFVATVTVRVRIQSET